MLQSPLSIQEGLEEMAAIAKENGLQLTGHVLGIVKRAATGKEEIVFDQRNAVHGDLNDVMASSMHSNTDYALDNLQAAQVAQAALSAALNGKDGLMVFNHDTTWTIANALGFMASAVHPTDPSGQWYRQWQGVYQNLTGSTETAKSATMGQGYSHGAGLPWLERTYATSNFADVTLLDNDIITINWKISVG